MSRTAPRTTRAAVLAALAGLLLATLVVLGQGAPAGAAASVNAASATVSAAPATTSPARAGNVVTPGNFTGYGFDQCLAPNQAAMDRWLDSSPFLAVGIYISGDSRACRSQPNLTPTWIGTQLAKGWRLLPITLGPQASCQPRFPRYGNDRTIDPTPGGKGRYGKAKRMGRAEAAKAVQAAQALGISAGSTLWYDLEGYDNDNTHCRESALSFLSGWTRGLHALGYVSGVYSSAGSGIKALDDARVKRPGAFTLPDAIWIARWDGVANTSTSYIREDGWRPGGRVKQYRGGHDETWGGVKINIDSNFLDLGRGSVAEPEAHCGGVGVDFPGYAALRPPASGRTPDATRVQALQCLLQEQGAYAGPLDGSYSAATVAAVRAWQGSHGFAQADAWSKKNWMSLLAAGPTQPVVKHGSAGAAVRRVQRALNAATKARLPVDGVFAASTTAALQTWQAKVGLPKSGVVAATSWSALVAGKR